MKILWFDTETTGISAFKNDIVSLAAIVDIDGKAVDEIYIEMQPKNWDNISPKALEVNGFTLDQLKTFLPTVKGVNTFNRFMDKHVDKYNRNDRFIPAGHNIAAFDIPFLKGLYYGVKDKYLGSYLDYHPLDTVVLANSLRVMGKLDTPDIKLVTLAKHFGVKLDNAHNALSDIRANRGVFYKMIETLTR